MLTQPPPGRQNASSRRDTPRSNSASLGAGGRSCLACREGRQRSTSRCSVSTRSVACTRRPDIEPEAFGSTVMQSRLSAVAVKGAGSRSSPGSTTSIRWRNVLSSVLKSSLPLVRRISVAPASKPKCTPCANTTNRKPSTVSATSSSSRVKPFGRNLSAIALIAFLGRSVRCPSAPRAAYRRRARRSRRSPRRVSPESSTIRAASRH